MSNYINNFVCLAGKKVPPALRGHVNTLLDRLSKRPRYHILLLLARQGIKAHGIA